MELEGRTKKIKRKSHHLTSGTVKVLQDIFHLFERSGDVFLDGRDLAAAMEKHGIHLTDVEVNSTLSILSNHDQTMDIHEFCYLVIKAIDYLLNVRDDVKSERPLLAAIKSFLQYSAFASVNCREVDTRKSARPLSFYFAGVRTSGLTEKQLAIHACSLDTSGNSPYKQPVVLPGLPPGNGASIVSTSPCTIIPPPPSEVGGKKFSRCTILPYEGGMGSLASERRRSTMSYRSMALSSKPVHISREVRSSQGHGEGSEPRSRGRPLSFRPPEFQDYHGRMFTFDELIKIRDEMLFAQQDQRLTMRQYAARKIVHSLPSEQFRKQFKHTIKAYLG